MVTVVLTSCGRLELLVRTIESFRHFNTYPIQRFLLIDDSGDKDFHHALIDRFPDIEMILNEENIGLIPSIDKAYSQVKTPYIFHMEDDWEFKDYGFIEKSIKVLRNNPQIMQVWLRGDQNPNGHPIEPQIFESEGVQFKLVGTYQHNVWHGFSFNPTVRNINHYRLIAPWSEIHLDENRGIGVQENHIGRVYFEQYGFRAASLIPEYCIHIGGWQRTYADVSKQNK